MVAVLHVLFLLRGLVDFAAGAFMFVPCRCEMSWGACVGLLEICGEFVNTCGRYVERPRVPLSRISAQWDSAQWVCF
jgi:hypothetical protein